jgi:hypothetical protein
LRGIRLGILFLCTIARTPSKFFTQLLTTVSIVSAAADNLAKVVAAASNHEPEWIEQVANAINNSISNNSW